MANEISLDEYNVDYLLKPSETSLDFVIDGMHFGRGDSYLDEDTKTEFKHKTLQVKSWKIANETLKEISDDLINHFYSSETYIVQWISQTDNLLFNSDDVLSRQENTIYFYWRGEDAVKGFSPLPESIEKENPPVERIVQWSEPPVFLQLFSGKFIVHRGKHNRLSNDPHLYILRGEMDKELHLYEVELKRKSLRSRTSFVLHFPKEKSAIIWHGSASSAHSRKSMLTATEQILGTNVTEIEEGSENDTFIKFVKGQESGHLALAPTEVIDYAPKLFYFNKITGIFTASEVECSHKSGYLTPFPFLQAHLYTADQPAIFLLDDYDEIWIWYGWQQDDGDEDLKSESFIVAINYAKQKSKRIQHLVKIHKVIAGYEPINFTNLFPVWKHREDVVRFQEKDGVLPNNNSLIEVVAHEDISKVPSS